MEKIECPSAFKFVSLEETIKEVNKLSIKKASQTLDIRVKIIKNTVMQIEKALINDRFRVLKVS